MLVQLLTGRMTASRRSLFSDRRGTYQAVRRSAFRIEPMGKTVEEKARWARGKAAGLWDRVNALEAIRGGDWQTQARRRRAASRLVHEAAGYERMAARLEGPDEWTDDAPF